MLCGRIELLTKNPMGMSPYKMVYGKACHLPLELEMPIITKINELNRKIQGNFNRLDSSMHKTVKTLETIKFHDLHLLG